MPIGTINSVPVSKQIPVNGSAESFRFVGGWAGLAECAVPPDLAFTLTGFKASQIGNLEFVDGKPDESFTLTGFKASQIGSIRQEETIFLFVEGWAGFGDCAPAPDIGFTLKGFKASQIGDFLTSGGKLSVGDEICIPLEDRIIYEGQEDRVTSVSGANKEMDVRKQNRIVSVLPDNRVMVVTGADKDMSAGTPRGKC